MICSYMGKDRITSSVASHNNYWCNTLSLIDCCISSDLRAGHWLLMVLQVKQKLSFDWISVHCFFLCVHINIHTLMRTSCLFLCCLSWDLLEDPILPWGTSVCLVNGHWAAMLTRQTSWKMDGPWGPEPFLCSPPHSKYAWSVCMV